MTSEKAQCSTDGDNGPSAAENSRRKLEQMLRDNILRQVGFQDVLCHRAPLPTACPPAHTVRELEREASNALLDSDDANIDEPGYKHTEDIHTSRRCYCLQRKRWIGRIVASPLRLVRGRTGVGFIVIPFP